MPVSDPFALSTTLTAFSPILIPNACSAELQAHGFGFEKEDLGGNFYSSGIDFLVEALGNRLADSEEVLDHIANFRILMALSSALGKNVYAVHPIVPLKSSPHESNDDATILIYA